MRNLLANAAAATAATRRAPVRGRHAQSGVVLLYAIVAIVLLMLSALALVRGMGTSLGIGGNFALRRDLVNQGELGVLNAETTFSTGLLANAQARWAPLATANYSETTLPTDATGIPSVLLSDTQFSNLGMTAANDIAGATYGVTIRYVIDRMCTVTGAPTLTNCSVYNGKGNTGGTNWLRQAGNAFQVVYRITVRVTGPKNTMTFLQTTIGA
jgi:Tfp pilus assembly protein PilX